jgi:hypothetical protein
MKANAFAFALDVVITPFPLVTRGFDGQVGVGGVFAWPPTALVAGKAIKITMMKGTTVQATSTVTDSWKVAGL